ncbi:phosphopantetheine-binding protein [Saccharothrix deserti]|uniref:phosphopantetheine-binding protein n=1 Tax=Saccharothrix deserti TaxID=2593674 RepID=UPI00131D4694|nr:phosphopantetheine-binding protein [Saccharothrix deserti]
MSAETEEIVLREWTRQLGVDEARAEDDFFGMGGNSLQAAELMAALSREFGTRLRLAVLLRNPVLGDLVKAVVDTVRR